jgi:hypothetical protein
MRTCFSSTGPATTTDCQDAHATPNEKSTSMSTSEPTRIVPTVTLNDGHALPHLSFGVFQIVPHEALPVGYRHIDTAEMYRIKRGIGRKARTQITGQQANVR